MKDTAEKYGIFTRYIHWIMGIFLIINYAIGQYLDPTKDNKLWFDWNGYAVHKSIGCILLLFIVIRAVWRLNNTMPNLPVDVPNWQKKAARLNIAFMYLLMLAIPITGLLMSLLGNYPVSVFGIITIAPIADNKELSTLFWQVHGILNYALVACFILHIGGALFHHFIRKDDVLKNMLNFKA